MANTTGQRRHSQQPAAEMAVRLSCAAAAAAADLEGDLAVGLRDLREDVQDGLHERQKAELAGRHGSREAG